MNGTASQLRLFPDESSSVVLSVLQAFTGIDLWLEQLEKGLPDVLWEGTQDWILERDEYSSSTLVALLDYEPDKPYASRAALLALCRTGDCFPLNCYIYTASRCEVPAELIDPLRAVGRLSPSARRRVFSEARRLLAASAKESARNSACTTELPIAD